MATTNPVYQVLPTSGDQALLAAGSRPDALANGQLGIFNFHTGLSVDGSVPVDCKDIFFALGIAAAGGTAAADDIRRSAGQMIQVRNSKSLTFKGYVAEVAKVVDITSFNAFCDKDYMIKLDFISPEILQINGNNAFSKLFSVHSACCAPTTDCDECNQAGNQVDIVVAMATAINADTDKLVTASYFGWKILATVTGAGPNADGNITVVVGTTSYTVAVLDADTAALVGPKIAAAINTQTGSPYKASAAGAVVSIYPTSLAATNTDTVVITGLGLTSTIVAATKTAVTDTAAFKTAFPGAPLGLRITGTAEVRPSANGNINLAYHKTGTVFTVSLIEGFDCAGVATDVTAAQLAEGKAYDLAQLEYVAGGWNGNPGPYRTNSVTGLQKNTFQALVDSSKNYNVFSLTYDQMSVAGWNEHLNNMETIIAVPCGDSTTLTSIGTMMDLIFTQFGAMANDISANGDCTNTRTGLLTPATDGIESLG